MVEDSGDPGSLADGGFGKVRLVSQRRCNTHEPL